MNHVTADDCNEAFTKIIHAEPHGYNMAANGSLKVGYGDSMVDTDSKKRFMEKLKLINGQDPYELPKHTRQNDISLWHSITYVNVCLYLVLRKS